MRRQVLHGVHRRTAHVVGVLLHAGTDQLRVEVPAAGITSIGRAVPVGIAGGVDAQVGPAPVDVRFEVRPLLRVQDGIARGVAEHHHRELLQHGQVVEVAPILVVHHGEAVLRGDVLEHRKRLHTRLVVEAGGLGVVQNGLGMHGGPSHPRDQHDLHTTHALKVHAHFSPYRGSCFHGSCSRCCTLSEQWPNSSSTRPVRR